MTTLRTPVTLEDHVQGPEDAQVTLLEYETTNAPIVGAPIPSSNAFKTFWEVAPVPVPKFSLERDAPARRICRGGR